MGWGRLQPNKQLLYPIDLHGFVRLLAIVLVVPLKSGYVEINRQVLRILWSLKWNFMYNNHIMWLLLFVVPGSIVVVVIVVVPGSIVVVVIVVVPGSIVVVVIVVVPGSIVVVVIVVVPGSIVVVVIVVVPGSIVVAVIVVAHPQNNNFLLM